MEVKSISKNFFRIKSQAAEKIENNTNHSNPFGVNFKGNIINADVFESSDKSDVSFTGTIADKVARKGKMWSSAIVGSINSLNEKMGSMLNPVREFGKAIKNNTLKLKDNVVRMCQEMNDTVLKVDFDIINYWTLGKREVLDLEKMLVPLV